jgi:acetolactate decarboxylase
MLNLSCEISQSLMNALQTRVRTTGEPLNHIIMRALADHLEVQHATLFQVSTSGALVEGISQGVVTVGELKRHGDLGLGTFADLDGEMVVVDGHFWRVPGAGAVREAADSDLAPFAVVTSFRPERSLELATVVSFDDLLRQLDTLRNSDNLFFAVRIDGRFSRMHTRAVCKKAGVSLVDAAANQAEFELHEIVGTIVGFWTPEYARTVNIAGWHLHFLSKDHSGGGMFSVSKAPHYGLRSSISTTFAWPFPKARVSQGRPESGPEQGFGQGRASSGEVALLGAR